MCVVFFFSKTCIHAVLPAVCLNSLPLKFHGRGNTHPCSQLHMPFDHLHVRRGSRRRLSVGVCVVTCLGSGDCVTVLLCVFLTDFLVVHR